MSDFRWLSTIGQRLWFEDLCERLIAGDEQALAECNRRAHNLLL